MNKGHQPFPLSNAKDAAAVERLFVVAERKEPLPQRKSPPNKEVPPTPKKQYPY